MQTILNKHAGLEELIGKLIFNNNKKNNTCLQFAQLQALLNRKKKNPHDGCASSTCLRAKPRIKRTQ